MVGLCCRYSNTNTSMMTSSKAHVAASSAYYIVRMQDFTSTEANAQEQAPGKQGDTYQVSAFCVWVLCCKHVGPCDVPDIADGRHHLTLCAFHKVLQYIMSQSSNHANLSDLPRHDLGSANIAVAFNRELQYAFLRALARQPEARAEQFQCYTHKTLLIQQTTGTSCIPLKAAGSTFKILTLSPPVFGPAIIIRAISKCNWTCRMEMQC